MKTTGAWGLDHPEGFPAARDSGLGCAPQPASDCRLHPDTRPTCPLASSREGPPTHAFTHCTALLTARELGPRRTVETFWRSEPTRSLPTWAPRVGGGGGQRNGAREGLSTGNGNVQQGTSGMRGEPAAGAVRDTETLHAGGAPGAVGAGH